MRKKAKLGLIGSSFASLWKQFNDFCLRLAPVGDLLIRAWVGKAFFLSGFHRFQSWPNTLLLFSYEYHLPWISPILAAYLATYIGLIGSVFLIIGFGGRLPALILFIFNIMMILSYPFFWTKAGHIGLLEQTYFAMLLMMIMLHGSGRLSIDYFISYWRQPKHPHRVLV